MKINRASHVLNVYIFPTHPYVLVIGYAQVFHHKKWGESKIIKNTLRLRDLAFSDSRSRQWRLFSKKKINCEGIWNVRCVNTPEPDPFSFMKSNWLLSYFCCIGFKSYVGHELNFMVFLFTLGTMHKLWFWWDRTYTVLWTRLLDVLCKTNEWGPLHDNVVGHMIELLRIWRCRIISMLKQTVHVL